MTISLTRIRSAARPVARIRPLGIYFAVWQQRRALAQMPDDRLLDMGISPAQAASEIARPIWDVPRQG